MIECGRRPLSWFAAALLLSSWSWQAQAEPDRLDTLKDIFTRLHSCWKPPSLAQANPIDITVIVSFNRTGAILGHPKITYESANATDNDRVLYRIAMMEMLQRCTPLPFTEGLGGAVAGRPLTVQFQTRRKPPPKPAEQRAWLTTKIL